MTKAHISTAVVMLALLAGTACGAKRVPLTPIAAVPAATGQLEVDTDENNNTEVTLKVRNLAPPSRLTPAKSAYVVWVEPVGKPPENEGQLMVGGNELGAELKFVTPYRDFHVFITPEDGPGVSSPSGEIIMRGAVTRD